MSSVSTDSVFTSRNPSKVTFSRRLKMGACGWSAITGFRLESVKINTFRGITRSTALIKVSDKYGKVTILLEGSHIGVLFGISPEKWSEIERISSKVGELFFRHFKLGLNDTFPIEQKIFYYFCLSKQTKEVFFISYQRVPNLRINDKINPFLKVIESSLCTPRLLGVYNSKRTPVPSFQANEATES